MTPEMINAVVAAECARFEGAVLELLRTNAAPPEAVQRMRALAARIAVFADQSEVVIGGEEAGDGSLGR